MTARQVAKRCGVELKTVHNWVQRGLLSHFRTPGRHLRFLEVEVERFLEEHGASPGEPPCVVLVGGRIGRVPEGWVKASDVFEAVCRAGATRATAFVIDSAVEKASSAIKAIKKVLPSCEVVVIGPRVPRGGRKVTRVASVAEAIAYLEGSES